MPVFTPDLALQRYQVMKDLIDATLHEGQDYGAIPGTEKKTLLKPGAEKLSTLFGLVPAYEYEQVIEDWGDTDREPLFAYRIKCILWRADYKAGEGMGYCSSRESRYRWRWVDEATADALGIDKAKATKKNGYAEAFDFAIQKGELDGPYGKPAEYWEKWRKAIESRRATPFTKTSKGGKELKAWKVEAIQYRVPNPDVADTINTVLKMAMKRAHVAAVIVAVNVSDRFTQDVEDFVDVDYQHEEKPIDTGGHQVGTQAAADYVAQQKIAALQKEAQQRDTTTPNFNTEEKRHPEPTVAQVIDVTPAGNGTSVKSATPPPGTANPESYLGSDAEWQTICRNVARPEGRVQTFDNFLRLLRKHVPEEADEIYSEILSEYDGAQSAKDIKLLSHARQAARKMYDILVPLMKGEAQ